MTENRSGGVEIYNRVNRLKIKAGGGSGGGAGKIDESLVAKANDVLEEMSSMFPAEMKRVLSELNAIWAATKDMPEMSRGGSSQVMANLANQIKDLAGTYGFDLMEHFGESLRDFILSVDLSRKEHIVIVQAHIDAMHVADIENLKHQNNPLAEELKKSLATAIAKYS